MTPTKQANWIDDMMSCINRVAPVVVDTLAHAGDAGYIGPEREILAGRLILEVAEAAAAEMWALDEFAARARQRALEFLAADEEAALVEPVLDTPQLASPVTAERTDVIEALQALDSLRLKILALMLQEGLSVAETAAVLGIPQWRVKQECATAVGLIHEKSRAY